MDTEDKALLRESLDGIVTGTPPDRLDAALAEFGWRELLDDEPGVAVSILLELQGLRLADASTLDIVTARAAGADGAAVVYPSLGGAEPSCVATETGSGIHVEVRGVVLARPTAPDHVLVPATLDGRTVLIDTPRQGDWPPAGTGIAPETRWATLRTTLHAERDALRTDPAGWRELRAAGHRALAHELLGLGGAMLELAVRHVGSRTQFGRTLGGFQAVKHQLADVRLWQECATLAADAAWEPAGGHDAAVAATVAKVVANRFGQAARQYCQQVLGGMGFTWEHDFHRYLKRALLLEPLLGGTGALHAELGGQLRSGTLPRLAAL